MTPNKLLSSLFAICLAPSVMAQQAGVRNPIPLEMQRVPIHTTPDAAEAGEYGWWAVGPGYKVSFHDGFAFHPHVGPSQPSMPLRWTTEMITSGGEPLPGSLDSAEHWHSDWRYEYRRPGITEAYDVRTDGVEQTFVFAERPARAGDLVVVGRLDTPLRFEPTEAAHAPLAFRDAAGREIVRYGAAFAVDALGRRLEVATGCADGRIQLTVPQAWLESAEFPITLDPLTSPRAIAHGDTTNLVIGRDHESTTGNTMVFYTMRYAQSDWDTFAFLCDGDFQNPWLVYAAVSTAWNEWVKDVAYAGGSDRWAMAYSRRDSNYLTPIELRLNMHLRGDLQLNNGFSVVIPRVGAETFEGGFAVGGSESGTQVLCAYHANAPTRRLYSILLNASSLVPQPRQQVSPQHVTLRDDIDVSRTSTGLDPSWLLTCDGTEGTFPSTYGVVYATRIEPSFVGPGSFVTVSGASGDSCSHPRVDGRDGRYLIAMARNWPFGNTATFRIDWPRTAPSPTRSGPRIEIPNGSGTIMYAESVAYDHVTISHWCVAMQASFAGSQACRVGFSGAPTETVVLDPGIAAPVEWGPPAVAFNPIDGEFAIAHVAHVTTPPRLQGVRFQYPADALMIEYGTACGRTINVNSQRPYAGSEFFVLRANALPGSAPCVLLLGGTSAALPLGGGCFLNVGSLLAAIPLTTDSRGSVLFRQPLPDLPLVQGDVFWQWAWAEAQGIGTSRGLRLQIR